MSSTPEGNLERRQRSRGPRAGEQARKPGECLNFKLLRRCKFGDRCKFRHVQPLSE